MTKVGASMPARTSLRPSSNRHPDCAARHCPAMAVLLVDSGSSSPLPGRSSSWMLKRVQHDEGGGVDACSNKGVIPDLIRDLTFLPAAALRRGRQGSEIPAFAGMT